MELSSPKLSFSKERNEITRYDNMRHHCIDGFLKDGESDALIIIPRVYNETDETFIKDIKAGVIEGSNLF